MREERRLVSRVDSRKREKGRRYRLEIHSSETHKADGNYRGLLHRNPVFTEPGHE